MQNWPPDAIVRPAVGRNRDVVLSVHVTFSNHKEARYAKAYVNVGAGRNEENNLQRFLFVIGYRSRYTFLVLF